ncbi:MAG: DUF2600 family protein, partial [Desulfosporosinus sp.]
EDTGMISERLLLFVKNSLEQTQPLEQPKFHRAVVQGLLAMYLSDEKSRGRGIRSVTQKLLGDSGPGVKLLYWLCCQLRKMKVL